MRSTVTAREFAETIKKVSSILKSSPLPQLEQVRVDFDGNVCRLTATDLSIWAVAEIPAVGEDRFSFLFADTKTVVRACRHYSGELTVELYGDKKDMRVALRCCDKEGEFHAMDTEFYPVYPAEESEQHYTANAEQLNERVKTIRYATIVVDHKPVLSGIRFEGNRLWCLDGQRMAISEDEALTVEKPFIIPASALYHLKLFDSGEVTLSIGKKYAVFASDTLRLTCRMLEGDPLKIENAMPRDFKESYTVERRQFADALKYLVECSKKLAKPHVTFTNGTLVLHGDGTVCSAKLDVRGESEICYAFDAGDMKEALEQFADCETVTVGVVSEISPIVLSAGANTALVLPVRMKNEWRNAA